MKQLTRLSPFSAKPKRRPHFGGEGYSRGAKTDPVFAPVRASTLRMNGFFFFTVHFGHRSYFGQTKGALSVFRRNTVLRQNEAETKATRSEKGGLRFY